MTIRCTVLDASATDPRRSRAERDSSPAGTGASSRVALPSEQRTAEPASALLKQHRTAGKCCSTEIRSTGAQPCCPVPAQLRGDWFTHIAVFTNNFLSCKLPGKQHLAARWNGSSEVFCLEKETMLCAVSRAVRQEELRKNTSSPAMGGRRTKRLFGAITSEITIKCPVWGHNTMLCVVVPWHQQPLG